MSSFWSSCLSQFEQELPPQQFNTWIRPLRLEGEDDLSNGLRLLAPNGFILKWVKERYLARIEELGVAYFSIPVNVSLVLGERQLPSNAPVKASVGKATEAVSVPKIATPSSTADRNAGHNRSKYEKTRLIPEFTFESLLSARRMIWRVLLPCKCQSIRVAPPITRCSSMAALGLVKRT